MERKIIVFSCLWRIKKLFWANNSIANSARRNIVSQNVKLHYYNLCHILMMVIGTYSDDGHKNINENFIILFKNA